MPRWAFTFTTGDMQTLFGTELSLLLLLSMLGGEIVSVEPAAVTLPVDSPLPVDVFCVNNWGVELSQLVTFLLSLDLLS